MAHWNRLAHRGHEKGTKGPEDDHFLEISVIERNWFEGAFDRSMSETHRLSSSIVAIVPPNQFGKAVWDELVKQGKLKKAGQGMYEMVEWWTL